MCPLAEFASAPSTEREHYAQLMYNAGATERTTLGPVKMQ